MLSTVLDGGAVVTSTESEVDGTDGRVVDEEPTNDVGAWAASTELHAAARSETTTKSALTRVGRTGAHRLRRADFKGSARCSKRWHPGSAEAVGSR